MKLAWQQIPSTVISEILCQNEMDGVVLDLEHGAFNLESIYTCIQVVTLAGKKCLVRLPDISKNMIKYCLDAGCDGIIFSTIETFKDSQAVRDFASYPIQGGKRGLGLIRQNKWGQRDLITSLPILICQIETEAGVKNIEEIWNSGAFNYCMIGPYDLSASLGDPGNFESENYRDAVVKVTEFVKKENMAVHIPTDVRNQLKKYEDFGIMALGMDTTFILEKCKEVENA